MEQELLKEMWFCESPIDFEHKSYKLMAYLTRVDTAFSEKVFSPYLLHTERLVDDIRGTMQRIDEFSLMLTKRHVVFLNGGIFYNHETPRVEELDVIREILEFSMPLLVQRVELGRTLHRKFPAILF